MIEIITNDISRAYRNLQDSILLGNEVKKMKILYHLNALVNKLFIKGYNIIFLPNEVYIYPRQMCPVLKAKNSGSKQRLYRHCITPAERMRNVQKYLEESIASSTEEDFYNYLLALKVVKKVRELL